MLGPMWTPVEKDDVLELSFFSQLSGVLITIYIYILMQYSVLSMSMCVHMRAHVVGAVYLI